MNRPTDPRQMHSVPVETESEERKIDLRSIFRVIAYRYRVIVSSVLVGVTLTLIYLLTATPLYTATTQIYIDTRDKKAIDLGEVVPGLGSDTSAIDSEVEIIKSASVAKRVISALHLANNEDFNARGIVGSLLAKVRSTLGLSKARRADPQVDEDDLLVRQFGKALDVKRLGLTYVVGLSYSFRDPAMAAKIANEVAEAYLMDRLEAKFEVTKQANTWLRGRLQALQAKVQESERAIEAYRAQYNLVGVEQETPFDAQLRQLNVELASAQVQMDERFAKLQQAREVISKDGELTSIDVVAQSDVVGKLREALATVAREEAELITRFTDKHPKVRNKRAERRDLERSIAEEAKRIVANIENEYNIARLRRTSIENSLQDLKEKAKGARSALVKLKELELEADSNKAIYKAFLDRFKETKEQETLRTADLRIITTAIPPDAPSSPKKLLTLVIVIVGSCGIGVALVFLLNHLDNTLKSAEQVEEKLKVSCLGSLPILSVTDSGGDESGPTPIERHVVGKPISPYTELMRTLKVSLQLSNVYMPQKVVMITSSQPNEGKTTVAANLAQYAARAGSRTLLIDADLRNPSLTERLLQRPAPGLVEVLAGKVEIEQAIVHDRSGVDFLPGSEVQAHAAEILGSKGMEELLNQLRELYDLIIIDTAPINPIVDSRVLAELVDGILLVIEWDRTPVNAVEGAIRSLHTRHEKITGAVLNKVDLARMASYKGDQYGRYARAYPHYYGSPA